MKDEDSVSFNLKYIDLEQTFFSICINIRISLDLNCKITTFEAVITHSTDMIILSY